MAVTKATIGRYKSYGYGRSDLGKVRANNEDELIWDNEQGIYAVIDGIGGHAAGEEAARIAKDLVMKRLDRRTGTIEERLREAITVANNEIYEQARNNPDWQGMACVMTVAVVGEDCVIIGHVGDTRLYKLRQGKAEKITPDHSPIGEREDEGSLAEVEAMRHPRRNEVFRDVGSEPHAPDDAEFVEIIELPLEMDCALLLCSDGLSDLVTKEEIARIEAQFAGDPNAIVEALIAAANDAGGKDNITAVYVAEQSNVRGIVRADAHAWARSVAADTAETRPFAAETRQMQVPGSDRVRREPAMTPAVSAPPPVATTVVYPLPSATSETPGRNFKLEPQARAFSLKQALLLAGAVGAVVFLATVVGMWAWRNSLTGGSSATTGLRLTVSPDGRSGFRFISDALAQARPGDTVEVAEGNYQERLELRDGVTLISKELRKAVLVPPDTLRSGEQSSGSYLARAVNVSGAKLIGFNFAAADHRPVDYDLLLIDSEVEVNDCAIGGAQVSGVRIEGKSQVTLRANSITGNKGTGVDVRGNSVVRFLHNLVTGNGIANGSPGLQFEKDASADLFTGNVILENGGPAIAGLPTVRVTEIEVRRNYLNGQNMKMKENDGVKSTSAQPGKR